MLPLNIVSAVSAAEILIKRKRKKGGFMLFPVVLGQNLSSVDLNIPGHCWIPHLFMIFLFVFASQVSTVKLGNQPIGGMI